MLNEMEKELEALLRQARSIFVDETALADVTVKGRANFVTRCDTGVQHFLQKELGPAGRKSSFWAKRTAAPSRILPAGCLCWTRWTVPPT